MDTMYGDIETTMSETELGTHMQRMTISSGTEEGALQQGYSLEGQQSEQQQQQEIFYQQLLYSGQLQQLQQQPQVIAYPQFLHTLDKEFLGPTDVEYLASTGQPPPPGFDGGGRGARRPGRRGRGMGGSVARGIGMGLGMSDGYAAGVMFGCTAETIDECFQSRLFGLPRQYLPLVMSIVPGRTALFLFNFNDRMLHGIFEATRPGGENIDSNAWVKSNVVQNQANTQAAVNGQRRSKRSPFPAQVRVEYHHEFAPMPESYWRHILGDSNRITKLNRTQVKELIDCFAIYTTQLAYRAAQQAKIKFNL